MVYIGCVNTGMLTKHINFHTHVHIRLYVHVTYAYIITCMCVMFHYDYTVQYAVACNSKKFNILHIHIVCYVQNLQYCMS